MKNRKEVERPRRPVSGKEWTDWRYRDGHIYAVGWNIYCPSVEGWVGERKADAVGVVCPQCGKRLGFPKGRA